MAAVTKNLGFGVTVATTYEQPYHLARRLSTIDHLTKGRLGWNVCLLECVRVSERVAEYFRLLRGISTPLREI
jgi:hypothetical protein